MNHKTICQSCGMPMANIEDYGTEKNGTESCEYCRFCYESGEFKMPDMDLEDMKRLVSERMHQLHMDETIIEMAMERLPYLNRWRLPEISSQPLKTDNHRS